MDALIQDMKRILISNGITPEAIEKSLREFHMKHSYNKHVARSYCVDAMQLISGKARDSFMQRKGVN